MNTIKLKAFVFKVLAILCIISCTFNLLSSITRLIKEINFTYNTVTEVQSQTEALNKNILLLNSNLYDINIELSNRNETNMEQLHQMIKEMKANPIWEMQKFTEIKECVQVLENINTVEIPNEDWSIYQNRLVKATELISIFQAEVLEQQSQMVAEALFKEKTMIKQFLLCIFGYLITITAVLIIIIKAKHLIIKFQKKTGE